MYLFYLLLDSIFKTSIVTTNKTPAVGVPKIAPKKKKVKDFSSKANILISNLSHILVPTKQADVRIGTVVFTKFKGKFIQHKISSIDYTGKKGFQLSRKGHVNCWTKNIYIRVENNGISDINKVTKPVIETTTTQETPPPITPIYNFDLNILRGSCYFLWRLF